MVGGDPGEADGENVLAQAERYVGEGFGRRCYGCADGGFAAVRSEGDGGTEQGGDQLHSGGELGASGVAKVGSHGHTNKCVQRIPDQIEGRNFVGKEFEREERGRGDNDPPGLEPMQCGRKLDDAEVRKQSKTADGSISPAAKLVPIIMATICSELKVMDN